MPGDSGGATIDHSLCFLNFRWTRQVALPSLVCSPVLPPMLLRHLSSPAQRTRIQGEAHALWLLAWPILVGQLANVGMSVLDVAMAGHASAQDLAGVSLGVSIWNMVIITLMGIMMSVSPIVSHHVGAKAFGEVPQVVRQALWKALGVGLIAMVLANVAALVFDHLGVEPKVRDLAKNFVHITSFALPAFTCYRVLYGYSASLNQTKPLMITALGALVLNGVVNWLLIFGNLGFPKLGGLGCAWSTLLCVWFNLLVLLWWMRRAPAYRSTWPFTHYQRPDWPQIRTMLKLGLPIGVTYFAETSAFGLIALLVARFGSTQIAAHQIALNFSSLVFMMPLSLGVAILTRVGQSLGANDPVAARFRSWVGVAMALGFAVLSASFMALFNTQIASAYTSDVGGRHGRGAVVVSGRPVSVVGRDPSGHQLCHSGLQGDTLAHVDSPDRILGVFTATGLCLGHCARLDALGARAGHGRQRFLDCVDCGLDGGSTRPHRSAALCRTGSHAPTRSGPQSTVLSSAQKSVKQDTDHHESNHGPTDAVNAAVKRGFHALAAPRHQTSDQEEAGTPPHEGSQRKRQQAHRHGASRNREYFVRNG